MDQKNGGQTTGSNATSTGATDSTFAGATGSATSGVAAGRATDTGVTVGAPGIATGSDTAQQLARQRETATEIARQRLLMAYCHTAAQHLAQESAASAAEADVRRATQAGAISAAQGANSATPRAASPNAVQGAGPSASGLTPGALNTTGTLGRQALSSSPAAAVDETNANSLSAPGSVDQSASPLASLNRRETGVDAETWRRYHTAWQNYYQHYYSEYYSNAARNYVAQERLKSYRAAEDERKLLADTGLEDLDQKPEKAIKSITGLHIRERFRKRIRQQAIEQVKHDKRHRFLIPILAGIAVVLVVLFLQYNRLIFTPIIAYVSPGNAEGGEITAVDPTVTTAVNAEDTLIIPKINVDVPIRFGLANDSGTIMSAMNNGVAHWSIPGASAVPGQIGNTVITGHSAGDIYSSNPYKFIFSGLERLESGDTIYIDYQGTRYTYAVYEKRVVAPNDVASLQYSGDEAILTLVTCTPLGTSEKRLLIFARQINPSLTADTETQAEVETTQDDATEMPSNQPTFFESIWNFLTGQS